jgi:hypothetical protein
MIPITPANVATILELVGVLLLVLAGAMLSPAVAVAVLGASLVAFGVAVERGGVPE